MRTWAKRRLLLLLLAIAIVCVLFLGLWAGGRREVLLDGTYQSGFETAVFIPDGNCSKKPFWFNWSDDYDMEARIKALGYPAALRVKLIGNVSRLGKYGHLGAYPREVWPVKIISVDPDPPCGQESPKPDFYDQVSQALVGQRITIRGRLSSNGKIAPASVMLENHEVVYLPASWGWGATYSEMEGKRVAVTGLLRFYHAPPAEQTNRPGARLPDHFFLDAKTTQVRLISP
jgi:hypothetical protein